LRLDQSFRDEDRAELFHDAVYGRQLAGLLEALGQAARFALPDRTANDWLADDEACARVVGAIQEVLAALCGATYAPDGAELSGAGIARATTLSPIADNRPTTILTGELDRFGRAARAKLGEVAAARICDRLRRPPFVQPDEESR
jgi:hypothetical protein